MQCKKKSSIIGVTQQGRVVDVINFKCFNAENVKRNDLQGKLGFLKAAVWKFAYFSFVVGTSLLGRTHL